jgi:hypothetical protein
VRGGNSRADRGVEDEVGGGRGLEGEGEEILECGGLRSKGRYGKCEVYGLGAWIMWVRLV